MRKITIAIMLSMLFIISTFAGALHVKTNDDTQVNNENVTWMKTYAKEDSVVYLTSTQQTDDGGYVVIGDIGKSLSDTDIWLVKIDENGNKLWDKTFGEEDTEEHSLVVQQTSDGGYFVFGRIFFQEEYIPARLWLIKTDINGIEEWSKTYEAEGDSEVSDGYCQQTRDGGYIIATNIYESGEEARDAWLIKTDENGDIVWDKIFDKSKEDTFYSVRQTSDDGYILGGMNDGYIWLFKTDSNGNEIWDKTFSYPNYDRFLGGYVQQTSDGGYVVIGCIGKYISEISVDVDCWLIKTDSNGNKIWDKIFGGDGPDSALYVQQTDDNGYIITGCKYISLLNNPGDLWLIKTDSNGNKIWERTYGESGMYMETGTCVQQTHDGGYIVAGDELHIEGDTGTMKGLLIKTNENGKIRSISKPSYTNSLLVSFLKKIMQSFPILIRLLNQ